MPLFCKKPVVIESWRNYTGDPVLDGAPGLATQSPEWLTAACTTGQVIQGPDGSLLIATPEGQMRADVGDWIIRGVKGELYPCKPDIFAATYEPVTEPHLAKHVDFGLALCALKRGKRVRRAGWNGKGMWLALTPGSDVAIMPPNPDNPTPSSLRGAMAVLAQVEVRSNITFHPHIDMRAADGSLFAWNPNCLDMLATDWEIVE